jgi:hypothetical protein
LEINGQYRFFFFFFFFFFLTLNPHHRVISTNSGLHLEFIILKNSFGFT